MNSGSYHDLISGNLCERKEYAFIVFQEYTIIFLIFIGNEILLLVWMEVERRGSEGELSRLN